LHACAWPPAGHPAAASEQPHSKQAEAEALAGFTLSPAHPDVDGLAIDVRLGSAAIGAQEPPLAPRLVLHRPGIHHVCPAAGLDRQVACSDCVVSMVVGSTVCAHVGTEIGSSTVAAGSLAVRALAVAAGSDWQRLAALAWQHTAAPGVAAHGGCWQMWAAPRTPKLAVGAALIQANALGSRWEDSLLGQPCKCAGAAGLSVLQIQLTGLIMAGPSLLGTLLEGHQQQRQRRQPWRWQRRRRHHRGTAHLAQSEQHQGSGRGRRPALPCSRPCRLRARDRQRQWRAPAQLLEWCSAVCGTGSTYTGGVQKG
jgi:hypothetical protein